MAVVLARSVAEAVDALASDPGARALAGGTDLMVEVNDGRHRPSLVVSLTRVPELHGWQVDGDDLVLGAATTYTDLLEPPLAASVPALAQAARTVGSPQIRNAGTIGGNLATASPAGDTLPVLVALGASVAVVGPGGERLVPVGDFLTGPKRTALEAAEVIVAVRVPRRRGPQEYLKVGARNAMVIAVASVAVVVDLERLTVGVGLGSVGPVALPAPDAGAWMAERLAWHDDRVSITERGAADRFGELVADATSPIDDHRSTAVYRRHAIKVLSTRALERIVA